MILGEQTSFTLQTSGSTGRPKQITVTREQLVASARATGAALGLRAGMRALVCLNTAYVAGMMMLVRCEVLGMEAVVVEPSRRPILPFVGQEVRFDFAAFVPMQLHASLEHQGERVMIEQMQAILVGGADVSAELVAACRTIAAPVYHTFGMTETVSHIALRRLNGPAASDWFVPLPSVQVWQDGRDCLVICGPMTNGEAIISNDRVELDAENRFRWLGRVDNVINTGGIKVQAEAIEAELYRFWPDQRLLVIGQPDAQLGSAVWLVVEGGLDEEVVTTALATLSRYHRPKRTLSLPQFPLTPSGKIDRPAVQEMAWNKVQYDSLA